MATENGRDNLNDTKRIKRKKFLKEIEDILHTSEEEGVPLMPPFEPAPLTRMEKVAYALTSFVGSWPFTIGLAILVMAWFVWNGLEVFGVLHFDEFPFIFLNLALSAMAGFQAPIILMAQNAQYKRDLQRDEYHHGIQVVTEAEARAAHSRLTNIEVDLAVLTEETDYVQDNIQRELKDLAQQCAQLLDGTAEYKVRVDKIADDIRSVQATLDVISREHIKIIQDMFEAIKKEKETNHGRAESSDTGPGSPTGSKPSGKPTRYRSGRKT